MNYSLFISTARGLEYLLEEELQALGMNILQVNPQGVYGEIKDLAMIYQLCLWLRLANRLQLILFSGNAHNEPSIYKLCNQFPWQTLFTADKTLAIEFHGTSGNIRNSMFGAQIVKDAIIDHFRKFKGIRPTINRNNPQIRLHAYFKNDEITLSYDLTGYSLHQRGYRIETGDAPLKENIAAAMLLRAKWPQLAKQGYALHDPFCGSGTLLIEAAMMASHIAPGLLRRDQSFIHWTQHQPSLWDKVRNLALQQVRPLQYKLTGTDSEPKLIKMAVANAKRAGVLQLINFSVATIQQCRGTSKKGLVISNPPYGERCGDPISLIPVYKQLGNTLSSYYQGWEAAILTANSMLAKAIGLRSHKQYVLFNGAIECKLYCISVNARNKLKDIQKGSSRLKHMTYFLKKNYQYLQRWANKQQIHCYRLYNANISDYAYLIDIYNGQVLIQEFITPPYIPESKVKQCRLELIQLILSILNVQTDKIIMKQKNKPCLTTKATANHFMTVIHNNAKFKVNLYDYVDTGLFLEYRLFEQRFAKLRAGTSFLNGFCYTATASILAALSGAVTTNLDFSKHYLKWAQDNFKLNNIDLSKHEFIECICLEWLKKTHKRFDVILLNPPPFIKIAGKTVFDLLRDHGNLIASAMRLLNSNGILYLTTHYKQFQLLPNIYNKYNACDITSETIDKDFKHSKPIYYCFMFTPLE